MANPSIAPTPEQVQAKMQDLLRSPAGAPPAGVTSNLENPPNLDAIIVPILAFCLTVSTMAIYIRSYTKMFLIRSIAYEDYVIVVAWIGQVGYTVPCVYAIKSGGGSNMWNVRLSDFFRLLYWLNISAIVYGITVCLIKLSILLLYMRIFVPSRKGNMILYVAIQILGWSIFLFYLIITAIQIAMCRPRNKIWNPLMTTGHCFNSDAAYMVTGVFNVVSDFSILVLPMIPIWKLQMPLKKKIMMVAIFALGIGFPSNLIKDMLSQSTPSACVTSILRTYYTFKIAQSPDVSYNVVIMGLWTWAEITTGILISCLPIMPRFFQHASSKVHGTFTSLSKSGSKLRHNSGATDKTKRTGVSVPFKRPFEISSGSGHSETWNESYTNQAHHKGDYITLDDIHVATSKDEMGPGPGSMLGKGTATKREDLETGYGPT